MLEVADQILGVSAFLQCRPTVSCLDGERSGPPEEIGGPYNYPEVLDAIADPDHEEHEHYVEWLGDGFDPEAFDVSEVNARFRDIIRGLA